MPADTMVLVPVSTEVSWVLDDVEMFGTITKPRGEGPFPGVVLVAWR